MPKTHEEWENDAMELINFLAPTTRRDEWWGTPYCIGNLADELKRMYGEKNTPNTCLTS